MSTIKLDQLESATNFLEWRRFIMHVLQAEGCWTHIEGTEGQYDIFPKSLEPAACTAASMLEEKTAFKEWWDVDMKARAISGKQLISSGRAFTPSTNKPTFYRSLIFTAISQMCNCMTIRILIIISGNSRTHDYVSLS
ncbi:hypothetical protein M413DRAFT_33182 [Hebeloma cylindrosporum]|uniref:Uncharacterized protein n=1 Tax=Hebeloma cylindrosporum TaxID=76867 RepID=A0A0C2X990_HEBCY|nr:hypothetical protein M413DRAFT_33182 [Hebeloma cylindrosporum h7]